MQVYRLSKSKYKNDLAGIGSKLYGGRWNSVGVPCVYTSENRALAILEYSTNVALDDIPRALHLTTYEIPEMDFLGFREEDLPGDWKAIPSPISTANFGSSLLVNPDVLGIRLPSIVVPSEYNYIINPIAVKIASVIIVDSRDYVYDVRVKA